MTTGTKIAAYNKSSKQNEPNEWILATVVREEEHVVTCRRRRKGPQMTVRHNYVRLMPTGEFKKTLMRYECSENISDDDRQANPNYTTIYVTRTEDV